MSNQDLLERAFSLADSGNIERISELKAKLIKDGYSYRDVQQIGGTLGKQLVARMAAAKMKE